MTKRELPTSVPDPSVAHVTSSVRTGDFSRQPVDVEAVLSPCSERVRFKPRSWFAMLTIGAMSAVALLMYQHAAHADPQVVSDQLFEAIGRDDAKQVEKLLDDGASPNSWGTAGYNILTVAALKGRTAITQLLLMRGADPNLEGPQHIRPLSAAVIGENEETVEVLVKNGAKPATTGPYVGTGAVFSQSRNLFD